MKLQLITSAAAFLLAASSTFADEDGLPLSLGIDTPFPAQPPAEEVEPVSLAAPVEPVPQDRLLRDTRAPFFDFEHLEFNPSVGIAQFSDDFEADPDVVGGLLLRVPMPRLGKLSVWTQISVSRLDRDINPVFYDKRDGNFLALAGGLDYRILDTQRFMIRPQVGVAFLRYDDIDGLEDGLGGVFGTVFGLHWVRLRQTVSFTYTPQLLFDGDWVLFHSFGLNVGF